MINKQWKIEPRQEFINITKKIQAFITKSKVKNGICVVYTKHTTACVRILEPDFIFTYPAVCSIRMKKPLITRPSSFM